MFCEETSSRLISSVKIIFLSKNMRFRTSCYSLEGFLIFKEKPSNQLITNVKIKQKHEKSKNLKNFVFLNRFERFVGTRQLSFFEKNVKRMPGMCAVKGLCANSIHLISVSCTVVWRFDASVVVPDVPGI